MLSNIQRIDIEFHSKCNRLCDWCPNKIIDRHTEDKFLDLKIFEKLIKELYDNGFGTKQYRNNAKEEAIISFLGYQEPLIAVKELKKYISIVKKIFHDRNIVVLTNSNGDYFKAENLNDLNLSVLNVMDYDCKGKKYWEEKLKNNKCVIIKYSNNILYAIHKNINLIQVNLDWPKNHPLEDRGGTFKPEDLSKEYKWLNGCKKRDFPCVEPAYYINIYHDGNVTPCCHIRPDNEKHKEFILGNIYNESIVDIFYGEKASNFRKIMTSKDSSKYFSPCIYCQKYRKYKCDFETEEEFPKILSTNNKEYLGKDEDDGYLYLKNRKKWTQQQISVWEKSKKYYLREIKKDSRIFPNSYYNITSPGFNKNNVEFLYKNYMKNWETLYNFYDYTYINKITEEIIDANGKDITFDHFSFTPTSLLEEYCRHKGFYQPFLAYKEKISNKIVIVGGRHRRVALKYGQENYKNYFSNIKTACYFLDSYDPNFIGNLLVPKDIYNNVLLDLNLPLNSFDDNYYSVEVSNAVDIWIIMKILEKEIDFYVEYYHKEMIDNNILPSPIINKEV